MNKIIKIIFIINNNNKINFIITISYKMATFNNYIYILSINTFIIIKNTTTKIIFIINYKINKNIIFNTNSTFIISYKVVLSCTNKPKSQLYLFSL